MRRRVSAPPTPHRKGANGIQHYYQCKVFDDRFRECSCGAEPDASTSVSAHPHADLMLKYAQIAQHEDKPWEQFEVSSKHCPQWNQCDSEIGFYSNLKYRLKPQPPVVQAGQTWVSSGNNTGVTVINPEVRAVTGNRHVILEVTLDPTLNLKTTTVLTYEQFLNNFKRKE